MSFHTPPLLIKFTDPKNISSLSTSSLDSNIYINANLVIAVKQTKKGTTKIYTTNGSYAVAESIDEVIKALTVHPDAA